LLAAAEVEEGSHAPVDVIRHLRKPSRVCGLRIRVVGPVSALEQHTFASQDPCER